MFTKGSGHLNSELHWEGYPGFFILSQRQILFTKTSPATKSLSVMDFLVEQAAQSPPMREEGGESKGLRCRKGRGSRTWSSGKHWDAKQYKEPNIHLTLFQKVSFVQSCHQETHWGQFYIFVSCLRKFLLTESGAKLKQWKGSIF